MIKLYDFQKKIQQITWSMMQWRILENNKVTVPQTTDIKLSKGEDLPHQTVTQPAATKKSTSPASV